MLLWVEWMYLCLSRLKIYTYYYHPFKRRKESYLVDSFLCDPCWHGRIGRASKDRQQFLLKNCTFLFPGIQRNHLLSCLNFFTLSVKGFPLTAPACSQVSTCIHCASVLYIFFLFPEHEISTNMDEEYGPHAFFTSACFFDN